jgi:hypothetical protein
MVRLRDSRARENAEVLEALSMAEKIIKDCTGANPDELIALGGKIATVRNFVLDYRLPRDPEPVRQIVVYLCFDDPLRPAGILIAKTHDELLVYNLLKEARKEIERRKHFATPAMYRVIDEIFADEHVEYTIVEAGAYREMEFKIS